MTPWFTQQRLVPCIMVLRKSYQTKTYGHISNGISVENVDFEGSTKIKVMSDIFDVHDDLFVDYLKESPEFVKLEYRRKTEVYGKHLSYKPEGANATERIQKGFTHYVSAFECKTYDIIHFTESNIFKYYGTLNVIEKPKTLNESMRLINEETR